MSLTKSDLTELTGGVARWKLVNHESDSCIGHQVLAVLGVIFQQVGLLGVLLLITLISDVLITIK